ncbi:MAG: recombinase family protein, partial [Candidatus Woesebacteria bacterium]
MEKKKCLIYCRVSSQRQVNEGHGLDSQELRCREYAKVKGYEVDKVFRDEGVSGGSAERPAIQELLDYLDSNSTNDYVVLIDDLSRLARDVMVHIKLRVELNAREVELICLNMELSDTEEGEMAELIIAVANQYNRKTNRRQVIQKMKARLEAGYWPFNPPVGLVNKKDERHGRLLTPVEPFASIFREAIIKFSKGLLRTLEETQQFISGKYKRKGIKRKLSIRGTRDILTQPLDFGLIEYESWGVPLAVAQHKGFVDKSYYFKIQDIFSKKTKYGRRRDINPDFPIRGLVNCVGCGRPSTGSWNKGRTKKYSNYSCKTKDCPLRYKVIAKDKLEGDFSEFLKTVKPQKEVVDLTSAVLKDVWDSLKQTYLEGLDVNRKKLLKIDEDVVSLKERLLKAEKEEMKQFYESEIEKLLVEKNGLTENDEEMFTDD